MNLHRALFGSLACAALLVGVVGCDSCPVPRSTYPASKSASNMRNTQWHMSGEETPQAPAPEVPAQPATPPTPAK